jgi:hypothetical protein
MKRVLAVVLVVVVQAFVGVGWRPARAAGAEAAPATSPAAAASMEKKLEQITRNASLPAPKPLVTELSQTEINSYLQYSMGGRIPKGVSGAALTLHPGRVSGNAMIDFDQLKASSKQPANPIVDWLVAGRKPVSATATFTSQNHKGLVHLEQVSIGAASVSGFLLDLLIRHLVLPRYPNAVIDQPFELPAKIDRIVIEEGRAVVYQR